MKKEFLIERTFDSPRDLVWKAWSNANLLSKWWGPKDFKINISQFEFFSGGMFLYNMEKGSDEMWGRFIYEEIVAPEKIVFINSFSNEDGDLVDPPFSDSFPGEIRNILTMESIDGKTKLTLKGGLVNPTLEESQSYFSMFESMQEGFAGTFDQLDALLLAN